MPDTWGHMTIGLAGQGTQGCQAIIHSTHDTDCKGVTVTCDQVDSMCVALHTFGVLTYCLLTLLHAHLRFQDWLGSASPAWPCLTSGFKTLALAFQQPSHRRGSSISQAVTQSICQIESLPADVRLQAAASAAMAAIKRSAAMGAWQW